MLADLCLGVPVVLSLLWAYVAWQSYQRADDPLRGSAVSGLRSADTGQPRHCGALGVIIKPALGFRVLQRSSESTRQQGGSELRCRSCPESADPPSSAAEKPTTKRPLRIPIPLVRTPWSPESIKTTACFARSRTLRSGRAASAR